MNISARKINHFKDIVSDLPSSFCNCLHPRTGKEEKGNGDLQYWLKKISAGFSARENETRKILLLILQSKLKDFKVLFISARAKKTTGTSLRYVFM
jgi:hypothetical protein